MRFLKGDCMKKLFSTQDAVEFLEQVNCSDIQVLTENDNGIVDFKLKHKNKDGKYVPFYAYASNYSMSAYNKSGTVHNFSRFWQDYLCERVEGYPAKLIAYLERQMDNDQFRHTKRQQDSYSIQLEKEFQDKLDAYLQRIDEIKSKYDLGLKK